MLELKLTCPQCKKKLKSGTAYAYATEVIKRKCPKCKTSWQIKATPQKTTDKYYVHIVDWLAL